jgi:phosphatidylglycerophosphatase A
MNAAGSGGRTVGRWQVRTLLASVGGLGFVPLLPGTAASAAALAVGLAVRALGSPGEIIIGGLCLASTALGFALTRWAETEGGSSDPRWFVLDEAAGMWLAMWATPGGTVGALAAFGLFRLLDIAKPPPVKQAERLGGPAGIMFDDLVAGAMTNILVRLIWLWVGR